MAIDYKANKYNCPGVSIDRCRGVDSMGAQVWIKIYEVELTPALSEEEKETYAIHKHASSTGYFLLPVVGP